MPRVSVIIPAYNPGPYLALAIDSVVGQTFSDWEIIVVDDGSPEDLSYVTEHYPSVTLIQQNNQGQSAARNTGIRRAAGEYVAFLDQDDLWLPRKVERQVALMDSHPRMGFCHTQFDIIDAGGAKICDGFGRHQTYADMLTGSGVCGATTVMVRRSVLSVNPFNTAFEPAEDYDLWLRLTRDHQSGFVSSCEALYRQHGANQTRYYRETHAAIVSILKQHHAAAQARSEKSFAIAAKTGMKRIRPTYAGQAFDQARQSLRKRNLGMFILHMRCALTLSPQYTLKAISQKWRVNK